MIYRPENTGSVRKYLGERDRADVVERAKQSLDRMQRDRKWLEDYRASGRGKSRFNWSTISSPTIRSTTNVEEAKAGTEAQAAKVSHGEGLGDAPQERAAPSSAGAGDEQSLVRGRQREDAAAEPEAGDRWEREVDTPF